MRLLDEQIQASSGQPPVKILADGALWFLQWDIIVGVSAALLWALTLRTKVNHERATLGGVVKTASLTALLGPCGSAAVAIWGRDELVFGRSNTEAKKGKSS